MKLFEKIVNSWKLLTIFTKSYDLDVRLGPVYTSAVQAFIGCLPARKKNQHDQNNNFYRYGSSKNTTIWLADTVNNKGTRTKPLISSQCLHSQSSTVLTLYSCDSVTNFKQVILHLSRVFMFRNSNFNFDVKVILLILMIY